MIMTRSFKVFIPNFITSKFKLHTYPVPLRNFGLVSAKRSLELPFVLAVVGNEKLNKHESMTEREAFDCKQLLTNINLTILF